MSVVCKFIEPFWAFHVYFLSMADSTEMNAASRWKPVYRDKPVDPDQVSAMKAALPREAFVAPETQRRVLVFSATANFRHESIPIGKLATAAMGKSTGAYEAIVSDDPSNFERDALKKFDAVLMLNTTQDFFMPDAGARKEFTETEWSWLQSRHDRLVTNLVDYVAQGGGLVGIHAATDACYQHPQYPEMIGALFDGHPWQAHSQATIQVENPEHSLNQVVFDGVSDFRLEEEIYQFAEKPYTRETLCILLHLNVKCSDAVEGLKREDGDYPVAWVHSFGQGRVFYTSLGHNEHLYTNPLVLRHYLSGIQFATGDLPAETTPSALRER